MATDKLEMMSAMESVAKDILILSRNTLLVNFRFLDASLNKLKIWSNPATSIATDGQNLLYSPSYLLNSYINSKETVVRDYLHITLHCIFQHMFVHTLVNQSCWDLACDIAVENIINEFAVKSIESPRQARQVRVINKLKTSVKQLTAEKIYRYYLDLNLDSDQIQAIRLDFEADDHYLWYLPPSQQQAQLSGDDDRTDDNTSPNKGSAPPQDKDTNDDSKSPDEGSAPPQDDVTNGGGPGDGGAGESQTQTSLSQLEQDWKDISDRIQQNLETFSKQQGDRAGSLMQNLAAVNREKYDYTSFLKKFAVMGEVMKINDDEFDYVFYTYGLKLYKNVPLIEPLEYKEEKRIREFVIAIDTSGSVVGELVQKFVQKTYNILMSTESFFSKINIHIIQCDADIQEAVKIESKEDFEEYLEHMSIHGLGGTDFRPVFSYVNELIVNKEFDNLKGLVYFTDGYGTFPERKPEYETAFVFIDDEYNNPDVPPWAIKLVMQSDEI